MQEPQPLSLYDDVTLVHDGGRKMVVKFVDLCGINHDQPYIKWPMAGDYKVDIKTGRLMKKNVRMWRICDEDLVRVKQASREAQAQAKENRKRNK